MRSYYWWFRNPAFTCWGWYFIPLFIGVLYIPGGFDAGFLKHQQYLELTHGYFFTQHLDSWNAPDWSNCLSRPWCCHRVQMLPLCNGRIVVLHEELLLNAFIGQGSLFVVHPWKRMREVKMNKKSVSYCHTVILHQTIGTYHTIYRLSFNSLVVYTSRCIFYSHSTEGQQTFLRRFLLQFTFTTPTKV